MQHPKPHHHECAIYQENPSSLPIFAIRPASHRVPEKIETANQACDTKHVLARGRSDKHLSASPRLILNSHLRVIFEQQNAKGDFYEGKGPKHRAGSLYWTGIG